MAPGIHTVALPQPLQPGGKPSAPAPAAPAAQQRPPGTAVFGTCFVQPAVATASTARPEEHRALALLQRARPAGFTHHEVQLSSSHDDPFVRPSHIDRLPKTAFHLDPQGRPLGLEGPFAKVIEPEILGTNPQPGRPGAPTVRNPFTPARPDAEGHFVGTGEPRFPSLSIAAGPDGRPLLDAEGLQQWRVEETHLGQTTAFVAVNDVHAAVRLFAGRSPLWGPDGNGQLEVSAHAFIEAGAYANRARVVLGVVPYRVPGTEALRLFEVASSWETVAHEAGHSAHEALKPNTGPASGDFGSWSESFADQLAMWTALQDPRRVAEVLEETGGDLNQSSSLTRMAELFGHLGAAGAVQFPLPLGNGPLRDAFNDLTLTSVRQTQRSFHEVLTGASYSIFQRVYASQLTEGQAPADALREAAAVMGTLAARSTEHTPETGPTWEDVGKAMLKVDQEYFAGRHGAVIREELLRRELLQPDSLTEWAAHEQALPPLRLHLSPAAASREDLTRFLAAHQDLLAPSGAALAVTAMEADSRGQLIVRFEQGDAGIHRHGVLVLRADGSLMDLHPPRGAPPRP